jgi:hypothetical protein
MQRRLSPTAEFLLAEFRACLGLRVDVLDVLDEQDERHGASRCL